MRITIICDVLGEANNGTTLAALNLIDYLKRSGHEVTVVCCDESKKEEDGFFNVDGLYLGRFINGIVRRNGVTLAKPDKVLLEKAIKDADIVQIQVPFALGLAALKIARKYKKPICASFHCQAENILSHVGLMDAAVFSTLIYKFFYKKLYRYCDRVHYPTEFIREVFESKTHPTNARVISNGVNEQFLSDAKGVRISDKFTIISSGRYCKEKNQKMLIDAIGKSRHRDEITLLLAGKGPDEKKLRKRVKKRGIDCRFKFFDRKELVNTLRGADLYVHAAVVEIEAISCLEAIACGLVPLICNSKRSATRFFAMHEDNLFAPGDVCGLAGKIDMWFENPEKRAKESAEYKDQFNGLSQSQSMKEMEQMLIEAFETHGDRK